MAPEGGGGSYQGGAMERITVRMPKGLVERIEDAVDAGHAPNRSELIRRGVDELVTDLVSIRCDGGTEAQTDDGGGVKGHRILNCDNCNQITLHAIVYSEHYGRDCYRCGQCQLTKPTEQITLQEAADS